MCGCCSEVQNVNVNAQRDGVKAQKWRMPRGAAATARLSQLRFTREQQRRRARWDWESAPCSRPVHWCWHLWEACA